MGFSGQEYWRGLPCLPLGDLPNPGIEPMPLMPRALAGGFFTTRVTWVIQKQRIHLPMQKTSAGCHGYLHTPPDAACPLLRVAPCHPAPSCSTTSSSPTTLLSGVHGRVCTSLSYTRSLLTLSHSPDVPSSRPTYLYSEMTALCL